MSGNAKQIWQLVLERVQGTISPGAFNSAFHGSSGIALDGQVLWVRAASFYAARAMRSRFKADIYAVLLELLGPDVQVRFAWGREEEPLDDTMRHVIDAESQKALPPRRQSSAAPQISQPCVWQQPLLPTPAVSPESERLPSNCRSAKDQIVRQQVFPEAEVIEVQAVPVSLPTNEEARVVDAEPVAMAPVTRHDGPPRLQSPAASAAERPVFPGSLFEAEDQPERSVPAAGAQGWRPWMRSNGASQPSSAEPESPASRAFAPASVDGGAALPAPPADISRALGAPLEEPPEPEVPAYEQEPASDEAQMPALRPEPYLDFMGSRDQASMPFPDDEGMLNPRYTFETFLVGKSNSFAYNAAQAVSQGSIQGMNPLFLHGGVGLGKTHLLHAIGHVVRARGLKVLYTTSENFTNEIINAIRFRSTPQFREKYRQLDMLMVDDIQLIAGKEATEEEFFNTFNVLHLANKPIVLSSDRDPNQIGKLHERLRSRLAWGVQPEIVKPEFELRVAILRFKSQQADLKLSDGVIELFAKPECESVRELESLVSRLLLYTQSEKRQITMAIALELYNSWQQSKKKGVFDLAVVLKGVADKYEITVEDLLSPRRDRRFAWPRQILMYLLREKAKMRYEQVGAAIGGRDHSTVMHAVDQVTKRIEKEADFGPQLSALWMEIEENFPMPGER